MSRIQIIELNYWLKEKYVCGFSDVSRHEFYFISNFAFCLIAIVAVVVYVAMVVNVHCVPVHACAAERNSNLEKYIDKAKTSSTLQLKIKYSRYCFFFLVFFVCCYARLCCDCIVYHNGLYEHKNCLFSVF